MVAAMTSQQALLVMEISEAMAKSMVFILPLDIGSV
jgi:hypothetical protein